MRHSSLRILLLALVLSAPLAHAQESRASIIGRTADPTGALIAGATVRALNTATNAVVVSQTNDSGSFTP